MNINAQEEYVKNKLENEKRLVSQERDEIDDNEYHQKLRIMYLNMYFNLKERTITKLKLKKNAYDFDKRKEITELVKETLSFIQGVLNQNSIHDKCFRKRLNILIKRFAVSPKDSSTGYDEAILRKAFKLLNKIKAKYNESEILDKAKLQTQQDLRQRICKFYNLQKKDGYHCLIFKHDLIYNRKIAVFIGNKKMCKNCNAWED